MATPQLQAISDIEAASANGSTFDAVVLVAADVCDVPWPTLQAAAQAVAVIDARMTNGVNLVLAPELAGCRLITSPFGKLLADTDEVRVVADAARAGVLRAKAAGSRRPLLVLGNVPDRPELTHATAVSVLACLQALWEPLEAREALTEQQAEPLTTLGVGTDQKIDLGETLRFCAAAECGRRLARDLGGTNPERMAPPRFAEYCSAAFAGTKVSVKVIDNAEQIASDYPLLAAVARAARGVERHQARIVRLEYTGSGDIEQTLLLAGKGVTYDTGGADIKAGGHMAGMSRDKGGGAAVAGLLAAIAELQPKNVKVIAEIGVVRNSVGANCYVTDEIIRSHARVRVRIGNTDAEGRLVLADLLSHLREDALQSKNPKLFSVATLTGHAALAVGPYSIALDNGPARHAKVSKIFSHVGDLWGDPFDVSRLRREDFAFVQPRSTADDVLSCNNKPSSGTPRGHQFPMAFLMIAAGLAEHGQFARRPLCYTHIDIAGSANENSDWQHGRPTGAPVVAMLKSLLE